MPDVYSPVHVRSAGVGQTAPALTSQNGGVSFVDMGDVFAKIPVVVLEAEIPDGAKVLYGRFQITSFTTDGVVPLNLNELSELYMTPLATLKRHISSLKKAGFVEKRKGHTGYLVIEPEDDQIDQKSLVWSRAARGQRWAGEGSEVIHKESNNDPPILIGERRLEIGVANAPPCVSNEEKTTGPEGDEMTDWKEITDQAVDKVKADHDVARTARKTRRAVNGTKSEHEARQSEMEATPQRAWKIGHIASYFMGKYVEQYGEQKAFATAFGAKGLGQVKHLLVYFAARHEHHNPEDQHERAVGDLVALIDHAFKHHDRLSDGLKINGPISPGVLLAYRESFEMDRKGQKLIGESSSAQRDRRKDEAKGSHVAGIESMDV